MLDPLEAYFRVLTHWNAKINLTGLPLEAPTDETFDRLLVEPLAAAPQLNKDRQAGKGVIWFDLGFRWRIPGDPSSDRPADAQLDDDRVEIAQGCISP